MLILKITRFLQDFYQGKCLGLPATSYGPDMLSNSSIITNKPNMLTRLRIFLRSELFNAGVGGRLPCERTGMFFISLRGVIYPF